MKSIVNTIAVILSSSSSSSSNLLLKFLLPKQQQYRLLSHSSSSFTLKNTNNNSHRHHLFSPSITFCFYSSYIYLFTTAIATTATTTTATTTKPLSFVDNKYWRVEKARLYTTTTATTTATRDNKFIFDHQEYPSNNKFNTIKMLKNDNMEGKKRRYPIRTKTTTTTKATRTSTTPKINPSRKKTKKNKNNSNKKNKLTNNDNKDEQTSQVGSNDPWYTIFTKDDEAFKKYMRTEWGFEKRGDIALFEKLSLEGAQAGLSWLTILRKRDAYRKIFYNFDINMVASMTNDDVERILAMTDKENPRNIIVRHRGKIEAVINNAKCIQNLYKEKQQQDINNNNTNTHNIFDELLWSFVNNKPILNQEWDGTTLQDAKSKSIESEEMSKALKKLGFKFVGPTTCYSMMQSVGMVIDHPINSNEWKLAKLRLQKRLHGYQYREKYE